MPTFTYKAKDNTGRTVRDQIIAKDTNEALLILRQQRLVVISVGQGERKGIFTPWPRGVGLKQLAQFSRQLATLVSAGMPLVKDLRVLSGQIENRQLKDITNSLCQHIEAGTSLSEALGNYPKVFSPLYINMVTAGEAGGALGDILERLATYLEKTDALVHRLRNALIYPAAVMTVALGLTSFLLLVVIPRFKEIFLSLGGAKLPLPTQILISISDFGRHYLLFFLAAVVILWILLNRYINTPAGKLKFDTLKLRIPLLGPLFQKFVIARFSRTLSTLLKSGVPILGSLEIVAKTAGNKVIEGGLMEIRRQVSQGQRIAPSMVKQKFFPAVVVEMVGVGEESGQLEPMLNKIAESYEAEVETSINGLVSLLEPTIIVFLAVVVGSIVMAMFLPILKITQMLGGGH